MDEFLKSFKAWLYDKSSNPLFFIFILCWLAWNYKLLVVAMSSGDASVKLDLINTLLYPTSNVKWCFMLLYPALTASVAVVTYPLFSNLSAIIFKFYGNLFAKTLIELDHKTPVDENIVNLIRAELIATQEQKGEIEKSKNAEIEELRKIITSLQSQTPPEKKLYPNMGLSELDKKIIGFMGKAFDRNKKTLLG